MAVVTQIEIENLKCGGCEKSILNGLAKLEGVSDVRVDHAHHLVEYTGLATLRTMVVEKLRAMGYPEKGTISGIQAGLANAKSYVSCAIGSVS